MTQKPNKEEGYIEVFFNGVSYRNKNKKVMVFNFIANDNVVAVAIEITAFNGQATRYVQLRNGLGLNGWAFSQKTLLEVLYALQAYYDNRLDLQTYEELKGKL